MKQRLPFSLKQKVSKLVKDKESGNYLAVMLT